jgi:hypothetical protein
VRQFLSDLTGGALEISTGMINGLSREFAEKSTPAIVSPETFEAAQEEIRRREV